MTVLASILLLAIVRQDDASTELQFAFDSWAEQHNKIYTSDASRASAFSAFTANDALINEHNAKGLSYTLGHNKWSDMTGEEWLRQVVGSPLHTMTHSIVPATPTLGFVPNATIDWEAAGAVTPVKDQANCGTLGS
jgi:hypothetical protein